MTCLSRSQTLVFAPPEETQDLEDRIGHTLLCQPHKLFGACQLRDIRQNSSLVDVCQDRLMIAHHIGRNSILECT